MDSENKVSLGLRVDSAKRKLNHSDTAERELPPLKENGLYNLWSNLGALIVSMPGAFAVLHFEGFFSGEENLTILTILWLMLYSLLPGLIFNFFFAFYATHNELWFSLRNEFMESIDKESVNEIIAIRKSLQAGESKSVPVRDLFGRTTFEKLSLDNRLDMFIRIEPKDVLLEWTKINSRKPVDNEAKLS